MSSAELEKFYRATEVVEKLAGMFKAAIVTAFSVCACVAGIAIWVNSTNAQATQTANDLQALSKTRQESLKEWADWRRQKDEIDIKLAAIVEAQQRSIDRQERRENLIVH